MSLPDIAELESLVPELSRLANTEKKEPTQEKNFFIVFQNAARLWIIKQSLTEDRDSPFYVEIELETLGYTNTKTFKCVNWEKAFFERFPNIKQKTLEDFLLAEESLSAQNSWKKSLSERYQIEDPILNELFEAKLFDVTSKTLRNHFNRLSQLPNPVLEKISLSKESNKNNFY